MLRNGDLAPDITLLDDFGRSLTIEEIRAGRILVILFTRFADCPTSRRDLLAYSNIHGRVRSLGAELIGVWVEPPIVSRSIQERLGITFSILSDPDFGVSAQYGVYRSDETDEGPQPHGEPAICIIDVDGKIAYSQTCSGPKGLANPAEIVMILMYMAENGGRYWQHD